MHLGALSFRRKLTALIFILGTVLLQLIITATTAHATAGINQQVNFQGRLLNAQGAVVPDGNYNIEFKIYQDGDGQTVGDTTGSPAGTLKWTEDYLNANSQGVVVKNGFLSVQLGSVNPFGSSVDWNQDTLWLSMNIAGTNASCTPMSACSPDGEMTPMKRLSSTPYSLNSGLLGGLSSAQFLQLAHGLQTDSSTATNSIYVNKTGTGNIIDLQSGGTDAFIVNNSGDISLGSNANHTVSVAVAGAGVAGKTLTIAAGAAGTGGAVAGGNLVLQGGSGSGTGASGSVIVKSNTTNSTTAFQVQTSAGSQVFGVDTAGNKVIVGQSSTVNGALTFQNSADVNSITLNSTGANSSYTLTLPSSAPAGGLCIETSTGSATQLVFASCSNNNASIQEVQKTDVNNTNTVTVSPTTAGNEMVLTTQIPTGGVTVSSVSGGGVTSWTKVVTSAGNGTVNRVEMWVGTVTTTGSSTITVTYSSSPGSNEIAVTEFTAAGVNASTSWGIESSASQLNTTASTTVTYPNMTAINGSELYVGYAQLQNPPGSVGTTSGFNYLVTSTQHNVITYNTSLAANTSYQPTAVQNSAGQSNTVAVVLTAFVTSTSINNTTSLQKANYYVQAASNGSVAGILQAASSGSGDILDLRSSAATNVVTVGNTGIATFKNSADSSSAFQVQNLAGNTILSVNTTAGSVALGTASALSGALVFNSSGSANAITLAAPSTIATNYNLFLPTNGPTAGLCLATSPSNANQLVFSSCATQVAAASISNVNRWGNTGTSVTTIADAPSSVGNLVVFYSHATNNVSITSISGGGVANWSKVTSNANTGGQGNNEMWRGVVTSAGSGTITVTYSAAAGTNDIEAQEFTMGSSTGTWAVDTSGTAISSSSVTTINYPNLTPLNSSELYTGYAWGANTMSAGTTAGFTYQTTAGSKYLAFNTSLNGGTAYAPTATQATAGAYNSIAAVIAAYTGTSVIVNSTAVQQANFDVQAAQAGSVAGVLQAASSGTADIFQAQNASGINVAAISPIAPGSGVYNAGLTLGTAGSLGGQINFAASGNSNIISLLAPTSPGASYRLILPTTTPAPGQCLASSPSNAEQLVFSSCANQVTSVAISNVNTWKSSTVSLTATLSVSPANLGDLMTLAIYANKNNTITSVSGGGVSTWSRIIGANSEELWRGVVTATGSSTITVTVSTPSGPTVELAAQEWTTGSATGSWVIDTSGTVNNTTSSTTVTYPTLTPQSTKDLYIGYAIGTSTMSAGSTSGFTYLAGASASNEGAYNTSTSTTVTPTATQSTSGTSIAVAALIAAYSSSSVISNSTNTQQANFNIQAATPGSVAGTLQAFYTGSGDALDILDGAGTLTDSFGSTGNLLVKPSTASASALRIQTTTGTNVLSADTSNKLVVIGAGSTGEASPSLLVLDNETGTSADPSVLNGAMYYNATTHTFRCGVDGAWQSCTGLLYSNTSNSSANGNCAGNCAAFSTAASIPANYCQPGRVIKLLASGYFSSRATASNLQFGVYYGTDPTTAANDTLISSLTPAASVTSASNNYFQINFNVVCFSTTTMQTGGILSLQTGSSGAGLSALAMNSSTGGTTVVSTSTKNLYIFPVWSAADTLNTATLTQLTVNAD